MKKRFLALALALPTVAGTAHAFEPISSLWRRGLGDMPAEAFRRRDPRQDYRRDDDQRVEVDEAIEDHFLSTLRRRASVSRLQVVASPSTTGTFTSLRDEILVP